MKIGIEAERANSRQKTGVEHYAKQLILHLAELDQANEYVLYLRTKPEDWFLKLPKNFKIKVLPFPIFWTQLRLSLELLVHPIDVLFIPASALPVIHPKNSVVTIHDLGWEYYPSAFTWFNRNFLKWSTKFAVLRARKIVAISESTRKDILKRYQIPKSKVEVIHLGFEPQPESPAEKVPENLPDRFVLFLSTLQPRKNLEGLIGAFVSLKEDLPELPHKLVVVGKPGWKYEKILKKINDNSRDVIYLNHVSDTERFEILKRACLLVLPSFYEGFGLPILEAFDAGVPVATSNVSSMPEVGGEAAVYFDPQSPTEIKFAIKNILFDKSLSDNLKIKGKRQLSNFSWRKCAEETLKVLVS